MFTEFKREKFALIILVLSCAMPLVTFEAHSAPNCQNVRIALVNTTSQPKRIVGLNYKAKGLGSGQRSLTPPVAPNVIIPASASRALTHSLQGALRQSTTIIVQHQSLKTNGKWAPSKSTSSSSQKACTNGQAYRVMLR